MDNGEQQYFSPNEPVTPMLPWWRHRRTWLLAAVTGLGMVVVACVVVFVLNSIKENESSTDAGVLDRIAAATAACAMEDDVAACEEKMRSDMARSAATPSACADLPDTARTNCIMLIAQDNEDIRVCASLASDMQKKCEDEILLGLALRTSDYAACAALHAESARTVCTSRLLPFVLVNGTCKEHGISTEECARAAALQTVVSSGTYGDCSSLSADDAVRCEEIFAMLDQDGDGLSAKKEYELGTDPRKADTDGDGYSDPEEVKSGNNPTQ